MTLDTFHLSNILCLMRDFFALQLHFASRVAELKHQRLVDTVFEYTNFFRTFGLREEGPEGLRWQEYLHKLETTASPLAWTMKFYGNGPDWSGQENIFGCFRYDYIEAEHAIKMHFYNRDLHDHSPLSDEAVPERKQELTDMFTIIRNLYPEAQLVQGRSWIYNMERYRRLFPLSYTNNLELAKPSFNGTHLWGQFINRKGELNLTLVEPFVQKIDSSLSLNELLESFPCKIYEAKGPIQDFYNFYNIT